MTPAQNWNRRRDLMVELFKLSADQGEKVFVRFTGPKVTISIKSKPLPKAPRGKR